MDKQKILEWANKLIQEYEDSAEAVIGEFSGTAEQDFKENEEYCQQLRQEIKSLLELD